MKKLSLSELESISSGTGWPILPQPVYLAYIYRMIQHFKQDNGGPSATWDKNGGYIG